MRNLVCLLLLGCSSDAQINITKSVGAEGGTVSASDGTSVLIPMNALAMSSNITITSVGAQAPSGSLLVGPAYDFGPDGTTFTQPVTITLPFDPSKLPSGRSSADVVIYTAPRGSTNYQALATTVSGNTVQTTTTHFTVYLPAVASAANCTPSCTSSDNACGCSESCNGHNFVMTCSQSSTIGPASCTCQIDGQTQSTSIVLDSCSDTQVKNAFQSQCPPAA
jgi:ZU5 domain